MKDIIEDYSDIFDETGLFTVTNKVFPFTMDGFLNDVYYHSDLLIKDIKVVDNHPIFDDLNGKHVVVSKANRSLYVGCKKSILTHDIVSIQDEAFKNSEEFDILIPNSIRHPSYNALALSKVKNITFEEGLEILQISICNQMNNVNVVSIPSSMVEYDRKVFHGEMINKIIVDEKNPVLAVKNGCLIDKEKQILLRVTREFDGIIPDGIKEIGMGAFEKYVGDEVIFPESVTYLGHIAFKDCEVNKLIFLGKLEHIEVSTFSSLKINYIEANNTDIDLATDVYAKILILKGYVKLYKQNKANLKNKNYYDEFIQRSYKSIFKYDICLNDNDLINYILHEAELNLKVVQDMVEYLLNEDKKELASSLMVKSKDLLAISQKDPFKALTNENDELTLTNSYSIRENDKEVVLFRFVGDETKQAMLPFGKYHNKPIVYDPLLFKESHPRILYISKDFPNKNNTNISFPYLWYVVLEEGIKSFDMDKLEINCKTLVIPHSCTKININRQHSRYRKLEYLGTKEDAIESGLYLILEEYRNTLPYTEEVKYNPNFTIAEYVPPYKSKL